MVFNVSQCDGIPAEKIPTASRMNNPIKQCDDLIESMPQKPKMQFKEQKAYYNPLLDYVNMPKLKTFDTAEHYYETFFHELVHSTGHVSRLNRKELMEMAEFWGDNYSVEELIAEMGACFLKSICGFGQGFEQNAAYLQGWLGKLKNDKHFVIYAAGKAQKAVDYILNTKAKEEREIETDDSIASQAK
jgi:antirestriction protein ArdC